MRQYAVLKNVARGVNFGIVVKSENVYKFFGWSEKGIEWSQWANKNSAGIDSLPDGISIGEFKSMPEEMMQSIVVSAEEARAAGQLSVERKVLVFHDGSERFSTATRLPSVIDIPLNGDIKKKQIAVNLKVKSFQAGVARSEIALNVRFNNLAFNNEVKQFVGRPNRSSRSYSRSVISSKISRGSERRFGSKIIDAINDEIIQTQLGFGFQRKIIGTKTANIFDYHVKARLGRTIGRALVPNRGRGNTRGALRAGMRSTREITGVLDPMKRRDIDGDGMIFDGTWREMPDPARFSGPRPIDGSGRFTELENRRRRLEGMGLSPLGRAARDAERAMRDASPEELYPTPARWLRSDATRERPGLRSQGSSGPNRGDGNDPRTIARDTTIDMLAGGADGDSAIRRVARTLGITDKDTIDKLSRLNYDVADRADDDSLDIGKLVDSSVKLPAKQRNAIVDALDEVAKTVRNVRNESNDPRTIARTIARDATIDTLAGGGDGDSAIRQVARSLGIKDKNTIDKLSALNYDVADRADEDGLDIGKLVDSSVDLPKNQRSVIVDALDEVAKTVRKEYGGSKNRLRSTRGNQVDLGLRSQTAPPTPNPRLLPVQRAVTKPDGKYFTKGEIKNLDNESLMNLMSDLFLPQEGKTAREQLDILNPVSANNVSELRDFAAREFVRRSMAKSLSKDGDEKFAKRVSKMETALKEPGSAGKDTKGNAKTIWNEALNTIQVDKDIDREERSLPNGRTRISLDNQPRRDGGAPDLTTRSVASLRSQRAGMRSETPGSARRATAAIDRAKQPRGLSSKRSERRESAKKSALSFNELRKILGKKKVADTDGDAYKSMTDTQRKQVKAAVDKQKEENDDQIKAIFKGWWAGQVRGAKKQSARGAKQRARGTGGRYKGRPESDPLTVQDIQDLVGYLDRAISKGDVQKFKVDKDGNYVLDEDGNIELSPQYIKAQRALDDALTMLAMQDSDNYELLEHLHSARRKKVAAEIEKSAKFAGDNSALPSILKSPKLSSAADYAGGEGKKKPEAAVEAFEKAAGKASLAQRILRMSPERERRIQLRAQRRQREFGRSGIVLDPEKQLKRRKLRAAAFRRNLISKFRKEKNPEVLSDDLGARRNELHPVQIAPDGTVTLKPEFTKIVGALDVSFRDKKRDLSNDQLLSDLWENLGYSETPVLVTEAEVKKLVEAGWQPIIRGTGSEEVESESYVEQFLTSEGRFIPGRGARAYGVGEYFAYPGGNWTGYSGNAERDRHSMLVLLPPSATIMTQFQLGAEQNAMKVLTGMVVDSFKVAGGRAAIEKMEAGEIAQQIRKAAPEIDKSNTRSAKILSELTKRLEEIDALPKTDELMQEKQEIIDSFDYLARVAKAGDSGYFAPIIGVDAIDANDGAGTGSPVLLHNRSITAAFQRPMTRNEAEAMVSGTRKVWTKWQRKPRIVDGDESQAPSPRPSRTRVGRRARPPKQAPSTETSRPSSPTAQPIPGVGSPVNTTGWTRSQPQNTGSNPATLLTAPDGTQYYTKLRKNSESVAEARERMETEVLASELYKLAGVPSADLQLGDDNGQPQMLSRIIQARMPNSRADSDAARDGFVVDAWLANWDAPLNDNIKFDSNGNPVRLDVGGSLDYRARGAKKGSDGSRPFGDTVGEITSLQKSGSVNFGNMDPKEIKRQAQQLSTVTDASIRQLVSKIVSDPTRAAKLAQTLINRRNYIVTNYG